MHPDVVHKREQALDQWIALVCLALQEEGQSQGERQRALVSALFV